jgi:YidC/Oxa1 family membrane protein insertase
MEKNTVIAIILSAVIITAGMFATQMINDKYAPETPPAPVETAEQPDAVQTESQADTAQTDTLDSGGSVAGTLAEEVGRVGDQDYPVETIVEETDLYRIVFSTAGGVVLDIDLLQEMDEGQPISMVLDGDSNTGTFNMAFGGTGSPYITDPFSHRIINRSGKEVIHEFTRDYMVDNQVFTLTKSYRIMEGEYLIELLVTLETPDGKAVPLLNGNEPAYTLTYGPRSDRLSRNSMAVMKFAIMSHGAPTPKAAN